MVSIQPFFVAPLAWLVSKVRRVPFIVDVRDLWPDAAVECGLIRSKFLIKLGRMFEMFVYKRAHHITVIGPRMKQAIADKGIDPDKIDVMPQGYQPPEKPPIDRESARARLGLGDEFVLMFTGSFGLANNDLPLIVDAAIRLKDEPGLRIVFVGEGNLKAECIERCRDAGVTNVTFLPIVPKNEIPDLLAAADASVMTLPPGEFWEICLQNKFFDYMGNGLPLVAAVAGDQERILRESNGGIVVAPRDLDGLVRAILELKQQPDLRRELGGNARRYVSENLMRSQIVDNYVDLLEQLVESPRA